MPPSEAEATADGRPVVRVLTWNIHGAIGRDRRYDLARVAAVLHRHRPDVVALQEVESRALHRGDGPDAFDALADGIGVHRIEAKSLVAADGAYGQLVASRWPMAAGRVHDISYGRREPRRIVEVELLAPGGRLRVLATHLGLGAREHRRQAARLAAIAAPARAPVELVLGDLNDWRPWGAVARALAPQFGAASRLRTFPARLPMLRLDRVWCRPAGALLRCWSDPAAAAASDHLPVIAEIALQA